MTNAEYKEKRNEYWRRLKIAWDDYQRSTNDVNLNNFKHFMETRYGLRVNMVGANIGTTYDIVNESKHTMFILKYGK